MRCNNCGSCHICRQRRVKATLAQQYVGSMAKLSILNPTPGVRNTPRGPIWYDGQDNFGPTLAQPTLDNLNGSGVNNYQQQQFTFNNNQHVKLVNYGSEGLAYNNNINTSCANPFYVNQGLIKTPIQFRGMAYICNTMETPNFQNQNSFFYGDAFNFKFIN